MTRIYIENHTTSSSYFFLYRYIDFFCLFLHFTDLHFNKCHLSFCRFFVEKMKTIYFCSFFFEEENFCFVLFQCTLKLETSSYLPSLCRSSSFTFRACSNAVLETNIKIFFRYIYF